MDVSLIFLFVSVKKLNHYIYVFIRGCLEGFDFSSSSMLNLVQGERGDLLNISCNI